MPFRNIISRPLFLAVGVMIALAFFLGLWQPWDGGDNAKTAQIIPSTSTLAPAAPRDTPTQALPPTILLDRRDCDEMRGTAYRSPSERTWFLANCVTSVAPPVNDAAQPPLPAADVSGAELAPN